MLGCIRKFIILLAILQMQWSQPQIHGDLMRPRAGHAGVTLDEDWYIVGGGDNRSGIYVLLLALFVFLPQFHIPLLIIWTSVAGAPDTVLLDMSKLAVSVLTSVKGREPLASEVTFFCFKSLLVNFGICGC